MPLWFHADTVTAKVEFLWVLGHRGKEGNKKAEECVVIVLYLYETMAYNDTVTPLVVAANKLS